MAQAKLLLDTNIVIDYLNEREPYYERARLLMIAGRVGEFDLWISSSQFTDLIYILSDGGSRSLVPLVLERLRGLRTFINVHPVSGSEIDRMLASSWKDPEDALLFEAALSIKADALISRNKSDFESALVRTMDCEEFFDWMLRERGLCYDEVAL
ncbi:PIN domain nuclease [Gordonibacter sp. An230]|uniref:type II toxin-antitoxin system VapC family toxin n=1 Tax=Gordonibacter sp. An230 TaxID=1965592 RepID=UPI000B387A74|nr:PIN domain-containing protein [Gordonibacter sp. An230]OUO91711.1 PIN domain nuclease [Gordonibacter sp. An230]